MKKDIFYYLGLFSYIGLAIAIPIFGGALIGNYLDRRFNTGHTFFIILLLFGVIDGFYNMFKIAFSGTKGK